LPHLGNQLGGCNFDPPSGSQITHVDRKASPLEPDSHPLVALSVEPQFSVRADPQKTPRRELQFSAAVRCSCENVTLGKR
jgi:hypothetical protein